MSRDRGVSIAAAVGPSGTDPKNVEQYDSLVREDSTVESVSVRIYSGAGLALRLRILRVDDQTGTESEIVRTEGKPFIDGDDERYSWDVSEPVSKDDKIRVEATNLADDQEFNFRANFDVDERAGTKSVIGEVLGL